MSRRKDLTSETAQDKFNVELEARRRGVQPYVVRATGAVNDRLVADLVGDAYRGISKSASMIPDRDRAEPVTKSVNGWQDAAPLKGPDTRWCDAQIDADSQRKQLAATQEELLIREFWSRLAGDDDKIASDYNPLSKENLEK